MYAVMRLRRDGRWLKPYSGRLLRKMRAATARWDQLKPIRATPATATPATAAREAIREYDEAWAAIRRYREEWERVTAKGGAA